jgi:nitroreductase
MLAMEDKGIGSCPQTSISCFPDMVREELGVAENFKLLMGISFGYVDEADGANGFRSDRDPLEKTTTFHSA